MRNSASLECPHLRRRILDPGDYASVGAAATEVAAHVLANLIPRTGVSLSDAGDRRHDLTRRAVTALQRVVIHERLLHRMQALTVGQPLDGHHPLAIGLD